MLPPECRRRSNVEEDVVIPMGRAVLGTGGDPPEPESGRLGMTWAAAAAAVSAVPGIRGLGI